MKNISIALNVVLAVAIAVLYYLHFSSQPDQPIQVENTEQGQKGDVFIAYIHSDSLVSKYQYALDENEKLQKRATEIERDYRNRAEGLQREIQDYQSNVGSLTIGQARAIQENLGKKEQNLRLFQESARQELIEKEAGVSRELYNRITQFLETYSEENGIQIVVKFDPQSDVLYAGKGLDITDIVLENINKAYDDEKNGVNEKNTSAADTLSVN
ncbi:MAG: OmpH family outer membrane protein [Cyclobacteriaceae bacterium]|nr:OmpH family outer membrane protein [Cyclobacteriaceae bacterium]